MQQVLLFLSALLLTSSLWSSPTNEGLTFIEVTSEAEWNSVLKEAETENKLIFIDAYTDWCVYCHKLDKEVYSKPEVKSYFEQNFINVKFDAEAEFGSALASYFEINSYPTLLYITAEAVIFDRIEGFVPVKSLMAIGEQAMADWGKIPSLKAKSESGVITQKEQHDLILLLQKVDPLRAQEIAKDYLSALSPEEYTDENHFFIMKTYGNQVRSPYYEYIKNNEQEVVKKLGKEAFDNYMIEAYNHNLDLAIKYGDEDLLNTITNDILPYMVERGDFPKAIYSTKAVFYGQREEFDAFEMNVNAYMNNHLASSDQPDFIISVVVEILESYPSREMYEKAINWLQIAIDVDNERFESHALKGYIEGLLGNNQVSNDHFTKAKSLTKTNDQLKFVNQLEEVILEGRG